MTEHTILISAGDDILAHVYDPMEFNGRLSFGLLIPDRCVAQVPFEARMELYNPNKVFLKSKRRPLVKLGPWSVEELTTEFKSLEFENLPRDFIWRRIDFKVRYHTYIMETPASIRGQVGRKSFTTLILDELEFTV